jgi:gliding motility-associated-like protein
LKSYLKLLGKLYCLSGFFGLSATMMVVEKGFSQTDTEFWFVAPEISHGGGQFDTPIVLRFTTLNQPATVTVSQPANGGFVPIVTNIAANSTATVDLTPFLNQVETSPANVVLNTGLRILATAPVGAYYEVVSAQCQCNPEIFSLKGSNALGTEFLVPFQNILNNGNYNPVPFAAFYVVGTEDNTTVTITPTQAIVGHPAGVPFDIVLNEGQTWCGLATSQLAANHPSGTVITSNKAVAVTMCDDLLAATIYGPCADVLGDQLVPTWRVGSDYIIVKGALNGPDKIFILGLENGTQITLGGVPSGVVNAGQTVALDITAPTYYLETSAPVYVLHMSGFGCEVGGAVLPPIICTGSEQLGFTRSTTEFFTLNITTQAANVGGFTINGNAALVPPGAFAPVPNTGGQWMAAQIGFTLAEIPQGVGQIIANSLGKFHMAIIHGSVLSGSRYGYFSDFSAVLPPVILTANEVCFGDDLVLQAESEPGANFSWTGPGGFSSSNQSEIIPNATYSDSGTYTVVAEVDGCLSNPVSLDLVVEDCAEPVSGIINGYSAVTGFDPCGNGIEVSDPGVFSGHTRALLIQMKGATADESDSPAHGDIQNLGSSGLYEFVNIIGIAGNLIEIEFSLLNTYDLNGLVQLISVPQFDDIVVTDILTAPPWDGTTGGVLVFEASGTVTLVGNMDVSGTGFRGGSSSAEFFQGCSSMGYVYDYATGLSGEKGEGIAPYIPNGTAGMGKLANGGGGGNHVNAGGGGGANAGEGGVGGNQWQGCPIIDIGGRGGQNLAYSNAANRVFLGGGGGGGQQNDGFNYGAPGQRGGGIIFAKAADITGSGGSVLANGNDVTMISGSEGCGGGGAGGAILLEAGAFNGNIAMSAKGGFGGTTTAANHGPGGGGGGGVVWLSAGAIPGNLNINVSGGAAGAMGTGGAYGALPGAPGVTLTGLQMPESQNSDPIIGDLEVTTNSPVCVGEIITLGAAASNAQSFAWLGPSGFESDVAGPTVGDAQTTNAGTYQVTVTDTFGCVLSGSVDVVVNPHISVSQFAQICEGDAYTLPDGSSVAQAGAYSVTLTATSTGCDSTVTVNLTVVPTTFSDVSVSICQGQQHVLPDGAIAFVPGIYTSATTSGQTGCSHITTTNLTVLPTSAFVQTAEICQGDVFVLPNGQTASTQGAHPVALVSQVNGCDSIVTTLLTVHPLPQPDFGWEPQTPDLMVPLVQFANLTPNAATYQWVFGDIGTSVEINPSFRFPDNAPGFYMICLTAFNAFGCEAEACRVLQVTSELNFWVPNAFSPNGDDLNEVFKPTINGHDPNEYLFQIFDRWGEKIFETNNPEEGWIGNHTGGNHYVQNDIYIWRAEVKQLASTNRKKYTGMVQIIR